VSSFSIEQFQNPGEFLIGYGVSWPKSLLHKDLEFAKHSTSKLLSQKLKFWESSMKSMFRINICTVPVQIFI
jgi:hypothetical protein